MLAIQSGAFTIPDSSSYSRRIHALIGQRMTWLFMLQEMSVLSFFVLEKNVICNLYCCEIVYSKVLRKELQNEVLLWDFRVIWQFR